MSSERYCGRVVLKGGIEKIANLAPRAIRRINSKNLKEGKPRRATKEREGFSPEK